VTCPAAPRWSRENDAKMSAALNRENDAKMSAALER
jgi:hypothetical protein